MIFRAKASGLAILFLLTYLNIFPIIALGAPVNDAYLVKMGLSKSRIALGEAAKIYIYISSQVNEDIKIINIDILSDCTTSNYNSAVTIPRYQDINIELPFCVNEVGKYNDIFLEITSVNEDSNVISKKIFKVPIFESFSFWTIDNFGRIFENLILLFAGILFGWIPYYRERYDKLDGKLDAIKGSLFPEIESHISKLQKTLGDLEIKEWNEVFKSQPFFTVKRACYGRTKILEDYYNSVKIYNINVNRTRDDAKTLLENARKTIIHLNELNIPNPVVGNIICLFAKIKSIRLTQGGSISN